MDSITVPAKIEELDRVNDFVMEKLASLGCGEGTLFQLRLAVEEIFVNIASYAYKPGEGEAEVDCEVLKDPLRVVLRFLDGGVPFDPLAREDADTSREALMERVGGLGILLVKKLTDDVQYSYEDGKNVLTIMKKL
jgi:sigma-B regulation protein RsbU (phosphoserine phosphatase)